MMDIYELIYESQLDYEDLCDRHTCGKCKYSTVFSCAVWYTFDRLNNHGYLDKSLDRDYICNRFYINREDTDDSDITIGQFIHWLYDEGYTKGVEDV